MNRNGHRWGPLTEAEVRRQMGEGLILPGDLAWSDGGGEWMPVILLFPAPPPEGRAPDDMPSREPGSAAPPPEFPAGASVPPTGEGATWNQGRVIVTPLLAGVNVAVFVAMAMSGVSLLDPGHYDLIRWGANFAPLTTNGQWWRLLSSAFLHIGLLHLISNLYVLAVSGTALERLVGREGLGVVYLTAAMGGSLAGAAWHPYTVSAGASGAIFGIFGALLAYALMQRSKLPDGSMTRLAQSVGIVVVLNLAQGARAGGHIDIAAHLGGLVTGFAVGCALTSAKAPASERWLRVGVVVATALVATSRIAGWIHVGDGTEAGWYRRVSVAKQVAVPGANGKEHTDAFSVFYSAPMTSHQAENVGRALRSHGYEGEALLAWEHGARVALLVGNGYWSEAGTTQAVKDLGRAIAGEVGGLPVTVELRNSEGQLKRTIEVDSWKVLIGRKDAVEYSVFASERDARALGRALRSTGFFEGRGALATVSMGLGVGSTVVGIAVKDGYWDESNVEAAMEDFGRRIAGSVGGLPIRLCLLDREGASHRELLIQP